MRGSIRLLKNLLVLIPLIVGGIWLFRKCEKKPADLELTLEETPLHIESIQKIAEVITLSFKDEVVVDSVEYYESSSEMVSGNLKKSTSLKGIKNAMKDAGMKRRLTLIVKGEAKIGFDLTNKNYKILQNTDTVWFHLPKAKLLDVVLNPSQTEVFQENGLWHDYARKQLMQKAKSRIEKDVYDADMINKAQKSMNDLLKKIISDGRTLITYYE